MKQFSYVIKDEIGLHARPAGLLAKEAKKYQSTVTLSCKGKSAAASKLMAIMGMGVKHGDNVEVTVEGADEDTAAAELQKFSVRTSRRRPVRQSLEGRKWKNILENPYIREQRSDLSVF